MFLQKIDLYSYFGIQKPQGASGFLDVYSCGEGGENFAPSMLIIPGGGYEHVSPREGEPVAKRFMQSGFNCYVLSYSVSPVRYPAQLIEGAMAMAYIRLNAPKNTAGKQKVCAVGFSAGGHLAGMLGVMFNEQPILDALKDKASLVRPDAVMLCYPVISADEKFGHIYSLRNLAPERGNDLQNFSLEKKVSKSSPPAFIWATVTDDVVPVRNSIVMADAYIKNGVDCQLQLFPCGGHGLSLATKETGEENKQVGEWVKISLTWLNKQGFNVKQ